MLLALLLLGTSIASGVSHAAYVTCRTDPTVYLSDGNTLVIYADIADSVTDVSSVTYELHVPTGVVPTGMVYDQYGYLESVTVIDDQSPGAYSIGVTVTTGVHSSVTANASITGTCLFPPQATNGASGHVLWLYFNC